MLFTCYVLYQQKKLFSIRMVFFFKNSFQWGKSMGKTKKKPLYNGGFWVSNGEVLAKIHMRAQVL